MDDQFDETSRMQQIADWKSSKFPRLKISPQGRPPMTLAIPTDFWENAVNHHDTLVKDVLISEGLLKHYVCLALQAAINNPDSSADAFELVDHVNMPDSLYVGHIWPRPGSTNEQSSTLTLRDLDDTRMSICQHTTTKFNAISHELQELKGALDNLATAPVQVKQERMADLPSDPYTNITNGLHIRLLDVLSQLSRFESLYDNPNATYNLWQPHNSSLAHMVNFCATLLNIPPTEQMKVPSTTALDEQGKKKSSIASDLRKLTKLSARLRVENFELETTADGVPSFLTYEDDSFYILKVHFQKKVGKGKIIYAYLGYLPMIRVLVYCSDWNSHPFVDGHPSRYTDESGNRVPIHFWNISDSNSTNLESLPKSIKHKVFRDKKDEGGLEYISLAKVEVQIPERSPITGRKTLPGIGAPKSKGTDYLDGEKLRPHYDLRTKRKHGSAFSS